VMVDKFTFKTNMDFYVTDVSVSILQTPGLPDYVGREKPRPAS